MIIQICVGSSCHLKGSQRIVELFQEMIEKYKMSDSITLAGSFCAGKCNREGVTVTVDDEIFTGLTEEKFPAFFEENILGRLKAEGEL